MTEVLSGWVGGIAGAAVVSALAMALAPKGRVRNVLGIVCGIVMIFALISPVADFDLASFTSNAALYREQIDDRNELAGETDDRLSRVIIEEDCGAYILDKAQVMGLELTAAKVTAKWGDEWYPYEVYIEGQVDASGRTELEEVIASELGIPLDRQYWSQDDA